MIGFLALVYVAYLTTKSQTLKFHFFTALTIKLIGGISVGLLYLYYYRGGDTFQYDKAARLILDSIETIRGWFLFLIHSDLSFFHGTLPPVLMDPRSLFFVKILSILYLLSGGSYWISSLYLSLISFWGSWYLVMKIIQFWPRLKYPAMISFLYFPPLVFWSSGVLKDAVAFACITTLSGWVILEIKKGSMHWKGYIGGIFLFWILWSIKYHLAAVMILSVGAGIIYQRIADRYTGIYRYVWFILFFTILVIASSYLHPNFRFDHIMEVLSENHQKIISISDRQNIIYFIPFGSGFFHFLLNLPITLFAGLLMPLPWQGIGFLPKLAGFFNLLILILTIIRILSLKRDPLRWNIWYLMLGIYILFLAILMAYAAPNFGTLERYKTAYIPFYLFWLLDNINLLRISKGLFIDKFW